MDVYVRMYDKHKSELAVIMNAIPSESHKQLMLSRSIFCLVSYLFTSLQLSRCISLVNQGCVYANTIIVQYIDKYRTLISVLRNASNKLMVILKKNFVNQMIFLLNGSIVLQDCARCGNDSTCILELRLKDGKWGHCGIFSLRALCFVTTKQNPRLRTSMPLEYVAQREM